MINNYADCEECETECLSGEEMRKALSLFNKYDRDQRIKCQIISMDMKALYPSIIAALREMIENSVIIVQDAEWQEVGK
jgi:hypothetical protein